MSLNHDGLCKRSITYNNALIEGKRITMPIYQVPELDELATSIYQQAGFEVVPVQGFELISLERGGSLSCAVKEIERRSESHSPLAQN